MGELARLTEARDTAVSQQLALLRREGMVAARRDGQMIFYTLASEEARQMLEAMYGLFYKQDAAEVERVQEAIPA